MRCAPGDEAANEGCLARACALVQALVDETSVGVTPIGAVDAARRRHAAEMLLDDSRVPAAVFAGPALAPQVVNAGWRALLGEGARDEPRGGLPDAALSAIAEVARTAARQHLVDLEVAAADRVYYCDLVLEPLRGPDGQTDGVIVACADVTDAAIARKLGVALGVPVWTGISSRQADHASSSWLAYTGFAGAAAWLESIHADDRVACAQAIGDAARRGEAVEVDVRWRRADGSHRWHRLRFASPKPAARWYGAAIAIDRDDGTRAQRRERALEQEAFAARADAELSNRLKDQFLAKVSHELRGPLATMMLWDSVLRKDNLDAELRNHALDAIHQSAVLQARLIADLLDMSRAKTGKLHVDLSALDVTQVLVAAAAAIAPAMAAKQIAFETHLGDSAEWTLGDAVRLQQVFGNVLANALKFTEPGGRVVVTVRREGATIAIEIADNGRGIANEILPHVFEPFTQSGDERARNESGLGLGLAVAHLLVTSHSGVLEVASVGPGLGTVVTVRLPATSARRAVTPHQAAGGRALAGARVLIVDDDSRVRDALALLLERAGAIVETAESARAARERVSRAAFDVWICDIAMPGEDGYALIRTARSSGDRTPAIALTAHASDADARRARDAGFDLHLGKPIDLEQLVASIRSVGGGAGGNADEA